MTESSPLLILTTAEAELITLLRRPRGQDFRLHVSCELAAWLIEWRDSELDHPPFHGECKSFDETWFSGEDAPSALPTPQLEAHEAELIRHLRGVHGREFFLVIECRAPGWRVTWRARTEGAPLREGVGITLRDTWLSLGTLAPDAESSEHISAIAYDVGTSRWLIEAALMAVQSLPLEQANPLSTLLDLISERRAAIGGRLDDIAKMEGQHYG